MVRKIFYFLCALVVVAQPAWARLTQDDLPRVQKARMLLAEVDSRSSEDILKSFNATESPEGNLVIYEAVAATYCELAPQIGAVKAEDKKALYDTIRMNVAFVQYGGDIGHTGDRKIHQWVRQALKRHLPAGIIKDTKLFYSLE